MSFCNIQVKRNSSEYKVMNKQGKESILYPVIVTNINNNTYNDNKDYFDDLLSDGKIQSLDNKELALGIYSIAYNSDNSEQYWVNNIDTLLQPSITNVIPLKLQTNPDYYNLLQDAEKTKQYLDYDNAKSLIQDYMNVTKDNNQKEVARFILANIDKINPRIKPFPLKLRNEDAYGQYDHLTNTIFYNPETLPSNPDLLLYLFNHEMIHALTMSPMMRDVVNKDGKLIEIINKIRGEFTEYDDYGFTDEFEFVAEYLTNIKFKRKVNTKLSQPTYKNFFDTLLDLIRKVFTGNKNLASIENMFKDIIEKSTISDYYANRAMLDEYVFKQKDVYDSGTMSNPPLYLEDMLDKPQIGNMSPMEKKNIIIDKYGKKFGKNKTIIDPQSNWGKLTFEIAEYNKGYGNKVLSLYQAPNGEWYIKIVEDKLDNKIGQLKGLKKDINENEISKMPTFNYTQYIDDLDFLSEDESEFVNSLFENGEQTLTCSI